MYRLDEPKRLRAAQILILLLAVFYGIDYLIEPPQKNLYIVEQLMGPLPPWGAVFLFFGMMGILGELWMEIGRRKTHPIHKVPYLCKAENRWWPSFTAHVALCAIYAGIAAGCVAEQVVNGHIYGLRVLGGMVMLTAGHWVFAQRRRHAP